MAARQQRADEQRAARKAQRKGGDRREGSILRQTERQERPVEHAARSPRRQQAVQPPGEGLSLPLRVGRDAIQRVLRLRGWGAAARSPRRISSTVTSW